MRCFYRSSALTLLMSFVVSSSVATADTALTKSGHTTDKLSVVKKRINDGKALLLDVREQSEWNAGHLESSHLLPLSVLRTGKLSAPQKKLLKKGKPIYCHCRSGGRVLAVAKILKAQGYDIRPLRAGYADLVKAGFMKAKDQSSKAN